MTDSTVGSDVQAFMKEARDRQAVIDIQTHYCHLVDIGRPDLLAESVYTHDAVDDHGGLGPIMRGREQINAGQMGILEVFEGVAHFLSNPIVVIDGDQATGRFYFQAFHWLRDTAHLGEHRPADFMLAGIYDNQYRREEAGWRISYQKLHGLGTGSSLAAGSMPASFARGIGAESVAS